jgi:hypothetical protein
MAYLLKEANLTHMAIHRVHYSVKKFLAQKKNLEFQWRQLWAGSSKKTDIHTHIFPFNSYGVAKSCGPDPRVGFREITRDQNNHPFRICTNLPARSVDREKIAEKVEKGGGVNF